ncbi:DMT family transporter [Heliobacterium chlorum]|nr:DMT family transporter [Heliobacterium chlorum]
MEKSKMEHLQESFFLFSAFTLAGTSVITARFVTHHVGTFTITVVSMFFAILCLAPLCGRKLPHAIGTMDKKQWLMLLLQALFGVFLFRMFLLEGLLHTSAAEAGILTGATPAITTILAWVLLKEHANKKTFAGILCTVGGILLVQGIVTKGSDFASEHFWGNMLVLFAAASESLFNIFSRMNSLKTDEAEKEPLDPRVQTLLVSAMALGLCLVPALFEHPLVSLTTIGLVQWSALAWYGAIVTALSFICWFAGIKRCSAYTAAAFSGMMPFTALILSVWVLGEHAGWEQWSGGVLIMLGMILIGLRDGKRDDQSERDLSIILSDNVHYDRR